LGSEPSKSHTNVLIHIITRVSTGSQAEGALRYDVAQTLDATEEGRVTQNAGLADVFLAFDRAQTLTEAQKTQGKQNLGLDPASLKGEKGDPGLDGTNGADGKDGKDGEKGEKGDLDRA